jgi:hypothetical protein
LMLLVLASSADRAARHWAAVDADVCLLTPRDLACPGWTLANDVPVSAVVSGARFTPAELDGVVCRLPAVGVDDVGWVHPDDRPYAVAELNAFLLAWLESLPCPVLNPRRGEVLCGWLDWADIAAAAAVASVRHGTSRGVAALAISVVDGRSGRERSDLVEAAEAIASRISLPLVRVHLHKAPQIECVGVDPWVAVDSAVVASSVRAALRARSGGEC